MKKQEKTELAWKVEELDRRLKASNDLVIFLLASIAGTHSNLSQELLEQFEEIKQSEGLPLKPEFEKLINQSIAALGDGDFDLDGILDL
ncbi:hypothetical protein ACIQVE_21320 [Pseudomonas sp. NPDC098747]|uniref:hypothetical protein n=1 Tax=Pseudomonas sp. NPDC098747 TaxID=3364487 RepID=UPI00383A66C2